MGAKRLVDIGLDVQDAEAMLSQAPRLSSPPDDAHKYTRGLLAVVAGEMPGAPILAAKAAMRSGAGYVKLLSEHSHPDAPADLVIEDADLDQALCDERLSAVLAGPGLGRGARAKERLATVMASGVNAILDADALHLLDPAMLEQGKEARRVVTPHEGELAKLCESFGIEGSGKIEKARNLHAKTGLTVLAKGPDTVLAGEAGIRCFPQGPSWLSVAGSGDVLAGIAASRLAQHGDTFRACEEAVWLHHEAARISGPAFTASDLAKAVGAAMGAFL